MNHIVNVLDLELTCYRDGIFPPGEKKEIIQFGICMVDTQSLSIVKTVSIPVIPVDSQVSDFCTDLTGWTYAKLLKQGVSFEVACERLLSKYGTLNRCTIVDSDDELKTVREQCNAKGIECPFGGSQFNIATALKFRAAITQNIGLRGLLKLLNLEFEGKQHRAHIDATNIARMFLAWLKEERGMQC